MAIRRRRKKEDGQTGIEGKEGYEIPHRTTMKHIPSLGLMGVKDKYPYRIQCADSNNWHNAAYGWWYLGGGGGIRWSMLQTPGSAVTFCRLIWLWLHACRQSLHTPDWCFSRKKVKLAHSLARALGHNLIHSRRLQVESCRFLRFDAATVRGCGGGKRHDAASHDPFIWSLLKILAASIMARQHVAENPFSMVTWFVSPRLCLRVRLTWSSWFGYTATVCNRTRQPCSSWDLKAFFSADYPVVETCSTVTPPTPLPPCLLIRYSSDELPLGHTS